MLKQSRNFGLFTRMQIRCCAVTAIRLTNQRSFPRLDAIQLKGLQNMEDVNSEEKSFSRLTNEISKISRNLSPTQNQIEDKTAFLNRLQQTVTSIVPGAVVSPFGSALNGFWSPNSDIDVCIQVPGCRTRTLQIQALRKIAAALHAITTHFIEPRFGARVPIIRWAPRRVGYLACDISINNSVAVINSRLVGTYCQLDSRLRDLGMILKYWAQARGINDRSRGTLSSFSLLLMLIHFLQRRSPPILPSLQDLAIERDEPLVYCGGVDVRFVSDLAFIRAAQTDRNAESTGELLLAFFKYFGHEYNEGVIAIRDLRNYQREEKEVYLVVDNPFEIGKDVANVSPNQYARIRQEFKRAYSILADGDLAEMCSRTEPPPPLGNIPPRLKSRPH